MQRHCFVIVILTFTLPIFIGTALNFTSTQLFFNAFAPSTYLNTVQHFINYYETRGYPTAKPTLNPERKVKANTELNLIPVFG